MNQVRPKSRGAKKEVFDKGLCRLATRVQEERATAFRAFEAVERERWAAEDERYIARQQLLIARLRHETAEHRLAAAEYKRELMIGVLTMRVLPPQTLSEQSLNDLRRLVAEND